MKLYPVRFAGRAKLPLSLQIGNRIDERGVGPWFSDTLCLFQCDEIGGRVFDNAEAIQFQLTDYGRFPRARRSSQHEPFHLLPHQELF